MANIYKSGAFLQQCFAVHPFSLHLKMFRPPNTIGISCSHCKSRHRLTIGRLAQMMGETERSLSNPDTILETCMIEHPQSLHITEVSIDQDALHFRCRLCKIGLHATINLYETCQP